MKSLHSEFDKMTVTTKPSVNLVPHSSSLGSAKARRLKLSQRAKRNIAFDGKNRESLSIRPVTRGVTNSGFFFPVFDLLNWTVGELMSLAQT